MRDRRLWAAVILVSAVSAAGFFALGGDSPATTTAAPNNAPAENTAATPPDNAEPPPPVTRIYDVADIVMNEEVESPWGFTSPSRTRLWDDSSSNGSGSGLFGPGNGAENLGIDMPPPTPAETLATLIKGMIATDTWVPEGNVGTIAVNGTLLVVNQTPDNQKAIATFLDELRVKESRQGVSIDMQWLLVDEEQTRAIAGDGLPRPFDATAIKGEVEVPYRCSLQCLDHQVVFVHGGQTQNQVVGAEPVVSSEAATMAPVVRWVSSGVNVRLQPLLWPARRA